MPKFWGSQPGFNRPHHVARFNVAVKSVRAFKRRKRELIRIRRENTVKCTRRKQIVVI